MPVRSATQRELDRVGDRIKRLEDLTRGTTWAKGEGKHYHLVSPSFLRTGYVVCGRKVPGHTSDLYSPSPWNVRLCAHCLSTLEKIGARCTVLR